MRFGWAEHISVMLVLNITVKMQIDRSLKFRIIIVYSWTIDSVVGTYKNSVDYSTTPATKEIMHIFKNYSEAIN